MKPDAEGFLRPVVEADKCARCDLCQKVCPILSPVNHLTPCKTSAYAAYHLDPNIRSQSTSGGVFTALCKWTLERGGVVFGAVYDEDFTVRHCLIECEAELWRLRGAKYVQSDLTGIFAKIKAYLSHGQQVLFSGTPCQTAGLQSYLGKTWETLLLVDVVCHGIPSPAVWKRYIQFRSCKDASGVMPDAINLRSKESGWPGYSVQFNYNGNTRYLVKNFDDPYLRAFVGDLCLRPSCYNCQFKRISRTSDFTLADYWGIERQLPELHDGKGTSLVMIHSAKAKRIWEGITPQLRCREVDPESAVAENPSAIKSSEIPESRKEFMSRFAHEDFEQLVDELIPPLPKPSPPALPQRILNKIKRSIHIKRGL